MELHFGIAELLGAIVRTHGVSFYPAFIEHWHETVVEMSHPHCLQQVCLLLYNTYQR